MMSSIMMDQIEEIKQKAAYNILVPDLYDRYAPAVYGKILSIINKEQIADRLLEKVFINAYKNLPASNLQTPLTALLNEARKKTNKTIQALNIFRECCAGSTVHIKDKK
jgi:hypothetical protein